MKNRTIGSKTYYNDSFQQLRQVAQTYQLGTEKMEQALSALPDFKVTVPVIGGFSTGKSSLLNAALGMDLLSTNISPETAVPTELSYGADTVTLIPYQGESRTLPLAQFDASVLSADQYRLVQIKIRNELFHQLPSLKLVDMPGFDSGIAVHNRAIDEYLPNSLAYILTVSADEGTLRESIIQFLNELRLHQMPVYVVLTKCQRVTPEALENTKQHIADTVRRFLKIEDVKIAVTNAKGREIRVDEFVHILQELQGRSEELYRNYFDRQLDLACDDLEQYLQQRLNQKDLSLEDLKLQQEDLQRKLADIDRQLAKEKEAFASSIDRCVETIKSKISSDLHASAATLETMLLQGTDITEKINLIVRTAVTVGCQTELEPRVNRYMNHVAELISVGTYGDGKVQLSETQIAADSKLAVGLKTAVTPVVTAIGTFIGTALGGPIGTAIGAALGAVVSFFVDSGMSKKQEADRQQMAQQKVAEIISSVCVDAGSKVETEIRSYVAEINEKLEQEICDKRAVMEKALADAEAGLQAGMEEQKQTFAALQSDLELVRGIRYGK